MNCYNENNMLKNISSNIMLTQKEMDVLNKYGINYRECLDMNDLLYKVEYYLNSSYESYSDLEDVSYNLSERTYYMSDNK